jgi:hypothetical protein
MAQTTSITAAIVLTISFLFTTSGFTANRYWVGGTGNWSDATNHWSATSGGSPGATKPTTNDVITVDASSGSGTITIDEATASLGSFLFNNANMSMMCNFSITVSTAGGGNLTISAANVINMGSGITHNLSAFAHTSNTIDTLDLTNTTINLSQATGAIWNINNTVTTFIITGSTIAMTATTLTGNCSFGTLAKTYNVVTLKSGNGYTTTINGAQTFTTLNLTTTAAGSCSYALAANITTTTLKVLGISPQVPVAVGSSSAGTQRTITMTTQDATSNYATFSDIAVATGKLYLPISYDGRNNTGILFQRTLMSND